MRTLMAEDEGLRQWTYHQPLGHGPILLRSEWIVQARCVECGWIGPDRTGDLHAEELVWDDSQQHAHHYDAPCGVPDCTEPRCATPRRTP